MRESSQARDAYNRYLELGPSRSLAKLHQLIGKPSLRQLQNWSSAHHWQDRIAEHERRIAAEAARQDEAERLDELRKIRQATKAIGIELQQHGLKAVRRRSEADDINAGQATQMIEKGTALVYRALGEAEQQHEHRGHIDITLTYPDGDSTTAQG